MTDGCSGPDFPGYSHCKEVMKPACDQHDYSYNLGIIQDIFVSTNVACTAIL